jgi:glycosyltransferase involved in cell wall biosynthesis
MVTTLMSPVEKEQEKKSKARLVNQHTFRALHQQHAAAAAENDENEDDAEVAAAAPGLWQQAATGCYHLLFNVALSALYWLVAPFNGLLLKFRGRPKAGRPLKVLRMTTMIAQGGVAKVCLQTVLAMPAEEVETMLLVFGGKQPLPPSLAARPDIPRLLYKLLLWPGAYKPKMFKHILKMARILIKTNPDVVHLHEPQFAATLRIAAALSGGRRLIVHLHNDYNVRHQRENKIQRELQKHALRRCHLLACSQTIFDAGVTYLAPTHYPLTLIEDGSDDRPDCPPDERLIADLKAAASGRKIIAKMAHLVPHKRIEDFLMACRILLDEGYPIFVLLMCYGKDKAEPALRAKFEEWFAPEEGEFLFRVHAPQHLLPHISIGVTTSALEGLGLNVLEYQVEGVPVVASDLIPHKEMITDGEDGLLFPVTDIPALVRALKQLLGDEALCRRLGEAGRTRALRRQWRLTGRRTAEFYKHVAGK